MTQRGQHYDMFSAAVPSCLFFCDRFYFEILQPKRYSVNVNLAAICTKTTCSHSLRDKRNVLPDSNAIL